MVSSDLPDLRVWFHRVLVCFLRAASTLFFLRQNQLYALPHNIGSRLAMRFAELLKSFVCFCINTGLYFNPFWIV